jgi:hypothetical protein
LAYCFLENDWDRSEALKTIDICEGAKPFHLVDFDEKGGPNFVFERRFMKAGIPCQTYSFTSNRKNHTVRVPTKKEIYYAYSAIYKSNISNAFSPERQWPINPDVIRNIVKDIDLDTVYKNYINDYWENNYHNFSKHLRLVFIKSVLLQHEELTLSEKGVALAMDAVTEREEEGVGINFIGFYVPVPSTVLLQSLGPFPFLNLLLLKWVSNYNTRVYAMDIFYIKNNTDGHTLLYINGNASPIHEFYSTKQMLSWFKKQCRNKATRIALLAHFPFTESESIYKLLDNLTGNETETDFLLDKSIPSDKSIFEVITYYIMTESTNSLPNMIVSNRDKKKQKFIDWIDFASLLILPFSLLFPQVLLFDALFIGLSLAEMGIAIDDMRYGKTVGRSRLFFGSLNALPLAGLLPKTQASLEKIYNKINGFLSKEEKVILHNSGINKGLSIKVKDSAKGSLHETGVQPTDDQIYEATDQHPLEDKIPSSNGSPSLKPKLDVPISLKEAGASEEDLVVTRNEEEPKVKLHENSEFNLNNEQRITTREKIELQGGADDEFPARKRPKHEYVSLNGIKLRSSYNTLEDSEVLFERKNNFNPTNKYFIENSKKAIRAVYYDLGRNCWRYKFDQGTEGSLALTINKEWEELSPELTIVVPHQSFIESFPHLPENWEEKISVVFEEDQYGPTRQVNGIIFKNGRYRILFEGEEKIVLYDQQKGYWHIEGRSNRLEFTTDKKWAEIGQSNPVSLPTNKFITHEDYYRYILLITLNKNVREVPLILNFVLTGETPEKFFNLLKIYQKAFENGYIGKNHIKIFTYGPEATINFFEKAESSIASINIQDFKNLEGLSDYVDSIKPYYQSGGEELYNLLLRLKLSETYPGIFLTLNHDLPVNIFKEHLLADETGILLQTPVYDDKLNQYVFPSNCFTSQGAQGKVSLLLSSFLDNLKSVSSSKLSINNYAVLFTKSVQSTFKGYEEYLTYYKATKDVTKDLYHLRFSNIHHFNEIDQYFGQLKSLLTKNNNKWITALKENASPSIHLLDDPESLALMQHHNIELVMINNEARLMFSTNSDVRELYTYKKIGNDIEEPEKTNHLAYFNEANSIEILNEKVTASLSSDLINYCSGRLVSVPLDGVIVKKTFYSRNYCYLKIRERETKVLYDVDLKCWTTYEKVDGGSIKRLSYLFKEGEEWKFIENRASIPLESPSKTLELVRLPLLPRVPLLLSKIPKTVNLFVHDLTFKRIIDAYLNVPNVIIHYDISDALTHEFFNYMSIRRLFTWNNVRTDPSFANFFRSELGEFYEAARLNNFPNVAYNIMQYQIIKEKGGLFVHFFSEPLAISLRKNYKARVTDVLLSLPTKNWMENEAKYQVSNRLFASHVNNPFFSKLNEDIVAALKKNDGYFGDILKGKLPGAALFPTSELVGTNAFNRAINKYYPDISALLKYLDHNQRDLLYYRAFEEAKDYFFPIRRRLTYNE